MRASDVYTEKYERPLVEPNRDVGSWRSIPRTDDPSEAEQILPRVRVGGGRYGQRPKTRSRLGFAVMRRRVLLDRCEALSLAVWKKFELRVNLGRRFSS
jgi:hypothetical protein